MLAAACFDDSIVFCDRAPQPKPIGTMDSTDKTFTKEIAAELLKSQDLYPVEFDKAWQWVGFQSSHTGMMSLIKSDEFVRGKDYQMSEHGWLMLSLGCFECWAAMLMTAKAQNVADCFYKAHLESAEPDVAIAGTNIQWASYLEITERVDNLESRTEDIFQRLLQISDRLDKVEKSIEATDQMC